MRRKSTDRGVMLKVAATGLVLGVLAAGCSQRQDDGTVEAASEDADTQAAGDDAQSGDDGSVEADPGITEDEIRIGVSTSFSGPSSVYGQQALAAECYWQYVNEEEGGVDGREVTFIAYDDAGDAPRTVENVRRLVEQDEVFALTMLQGTHGNQSILDYVNENEIPQVFINTGASQWGDMEETPWTIGGIPAYTTEGGALASYAAENHPGATIAMLYQDGDFGKDAAEGVKLAIEQNDYDLEVVAEESYEFTQPSVAPQMNNLAQSEADIFINWAAGQAATQSIARLHELSWDPVHLAGSWVTPIGSVLEPAGLDAAQGIVSTAYQMDPSDEQFDDDPGMQKFRSILEDCDEDLEPDFNTAGGVRAAQELHAALKGMEAPTREALMDSVLSLKDVELMTLLPGITVTTGPDDAFPIESLQFMRFDGESWTQFGDPISYEGRTPVAELS